MFSSDYCLAGPLIVITKRIIISAIAAAIYFQSQPIIIIHSSLYVFPKASQKDALIYWLIDNEVPSD